MSTPQTSGTAHLVLIPANREGECFISFKLPPFDFHGLDAGGGEPGGLRLLLSPAALLICIPADRKISARKMLFFYASAVHFSRTRWVGGK